MIVAYLHRHNTPILSLPLLSLSLSPLFLSFSQSPLFLSFSLSPLFFFLFSSPHPPPFFLVTLLHRLLLSHPLPSAPTIPHRTYLYRIGAGLKGSCSLNSAAAGEGQARIGIYAINRPEWIKTLFAAYSQRIVAVRFRPKSSNVRDDTPLCRVHIVAVRNIDSSRPHAVHNGATPSMAHTGDLIN